MNMTPYKLTTCKNQSGQVLIEAILALAVFLLFLTFTWEVCRITRNELQKIRYAK